MLTTLLSKVRRPAPRVPEVETAVAKARDEVEALCRERASVARALLDSQTQLRATAFTKVDRRPALRAKVGELQARITAIDKQIDELRHDLAASAAAVAEVRSEDKAALATEMLSAYRADVKAANDAMLVVSKAFARLKATRDEIDQAFAGPLGYEGLGKPSAVLGLGYEFTDLIGDDVHPGRFDLWRKDVAEHFPGLL